MESRKTAKAMKWRDTAIRKMREKDFAGGKQSAEEAQKLCPSLENIDQIILVCNVHCAAAENKDWYEILCVAATADEATVRSRCSRMALGLHPDKNKFPGAAEAFQLFVEAKAVLLNSEKRRVYDSMRRAKAMGENWSSNSDSFKIQQQIDEKIKNWDVLLSRYGVNQLIANGFLNSGQPSSEIRANGGGRGRGRGRGRGGGRGSNLMSSKKENMVDFDQSDRPNSENGADIGRGRGRGRGRPRKLNKASNFEGLIISSSSNENVVNLGQNDQPSSENQPNVVRGRGRGRGRCRAKVLGEGVENARAAKRSKKNSGSSATEEADKNEKKGVEFESAPVIEQDSKILEYADAEFNDFEKQRCKTCFAEGQIWAVYDTLDAMPRFYTLIRKISKNDNRMQITWLEPLPHNEDEKQWLHKGLPASSGKFKLGHTEIIQDHAVFSHQVNFSVLDKVYEIHPKKGETWAVFKKWDMSKPQRFGAFEYEVVEILSDYFIEFGVNVGFLEKIEGYCCVFGRRVGKGVDWEVIAMQDRLRFSHRIPCVSVNIKLKNFFELDPASLPPNM